MPKRIRGEQGKFIPKSDEYRSVRSLRLTDSAWEILGRIASERCITRADLIEELVNSDVLHGNLEQENEKLREEIATLESQIAELSSNTLPSLTAGKRHQLQLFPSSEFSARDRLIEIRDRVLDMGILRVGKQAKYYKETVKAFDKFVEILLDELF